jgi:hypothetical protein
VIADSVKFETPDPKTFSNFVNGVQLLNVEIVRLLGERLLAGASPSTTFELKSSYSYDPPHLFLRYDVTASLLDDESDIVARVEASVVLAIEVRDAEGPVAPNVLELFASSSGRIIANPYLRELINATSSRLGYPGVIFPVTIGVMPITLSMVPDRLLAQGSGPPEVEG